MNKSIDALGTIVGLLSPLPSEERQRLMRAAMVLLGEDQSAVSSTAPSDQGGALSGLPPKALSWMKQNSITEDQLQQAFHIGDGVVDVIGELPGRNKKEQTYNAYVVAGIGQLLLRGDASFDDKAARSLCVQAGCYDSANHSSHLNGRGNEFAGSKEKGWTLTAPGLKRGADIIKQMQNAS